MPSLQLYSQVLQAAVQKTPSCAIHVTQLSSSVQEHDLRSFFGFCGSISSIQVIERDEKKEALVVFEKSQAATTACLLGNAVVCGQAIQVSSYTDAVSSIAANEPSQSTLDGQLGTSSSSTRPTDEQLSIGSKIAQLLASGYILSEAVVQKVVDMDTNYGVIPHLTRAASGAYELASNIATRYHLVDHVVRLKDGVVAKAAEWDSAYGISDYAKKVAESSPGKAAIAGAEKGKQAVMEVGAETKRLIEKEHSARNLANAEGGNAETEMKDPTDESVNAQ